MDPVPTHHRPGTLVAIRDGLTDTTTVLSVATTEQRSAAPVEG
jgi:hypothetical protein